MIEAVIRARCGRDDLVFGQSGDGETTLLHAETVRRLAGTEQGRSIEEVDSVEDWDEPWSPVEAANIVLLEYTRLVREEPVEPVEVHAYVGEAGCIRAMTAEYSDGHAVLVTHLGFETGDE